MALIQEDLDNSLEIVKLIDSENTSAAMSSEDNLLLDKVAEVKKSVEESAEDTEEEQFVQEDDGTADEASEEDGLKDLGTKKTTVAAEALRHDYYDRMAAEAFFEEGGVAHKVASAVGHGIAATSVYAFNLAKDLSIVLKDLSFQYGPIVFSRLKSGVMYLLVRLLKSFMKMRVALANAYQQKKNSFSKYQKRVSRLRETLVTMSQVELQLTQPEPFRDEELFKWFFAHGKPSPLEALKAIDSLMDVVVEEIDQGIQHELEITKRLIELTNRGVRSDLYPYMEVKGITARFAKQRVDGYDHNDELIDNYVFNQSLPAYTLLMFGLPKKEVIKAASTSDSLDNVIKAYQDSYVILGINPSIPKTVPMINYMDSKSLLKLLDGLEAICQKGLRHVEFYKNIEKKALGLKTNYQHYFAWLTADNQAKSLQESLAELIYLKQSFATKVYLPGALDIHDYVGLYLNTMLRYIESNIKNLVPVQQNSTD